VDKADVIVLINSNPMETYPSFGWKIRQAAKKGTKIIVINSNRIDPVRHATLWLQPRKGTSTYVLSAIMKHIVELNRYDNKFIEENTENFKSFEDFITGFDVEEISYVAGVLPEKITKAANIMSQGSPKIMVVYDFDNPIDRSIGDLPAIANLLLLTGNIKEQGRGLILLQKHSNTMGLYDMGGEPGFLPGRISLDSQENRKNIDQLWGNKVRLSVKKDDIRDLFLNNKIKGVIIIGENPLENPSEARMLRGTDFILTTDLFMTETCRFSDMILPASAPAESGGSYTRLDRKVQSFPSAYPPPSGKTTLEIICQISELMGKNIDILTPEKAFEEIKKINYLYKGIDLDSKEECKHFWTHDLKGSCCTALYCGNFATTSGKAIFTTYPVDTKTFYVDDYSINVIESRYREWIKKLFSKEKKIPVIV
jgi:predicted molibdopterin-dependent oxidoreductase YjgC